MALVFVTTNLAKWGVGTGTLHPAAVADNNFWELDVRVTELEENPLQPVSIANIVLDGNSLSVVLTNAAVQGPFEIPVATFRFVGEWEPLTQYFVNDVVRDTRTGLYLVRLEHVSEAEFDSGLDVSGELVYELLMPSVRYVFSFYVPGSPGALSEVGDPMFAHVAADAFVLQAGLPDAQGRVTVAPENNLDGVIQRNGVEVGTFQVAAGQTEATFAFAADVTFNVGDVMTVPRPETIDGAARNLFLTFAGVKISQT
jgi:hypothetical protein